MPVTEITKDNHKHFPKKKIIKKRVIKKTSRGAKYLKFRATAYTAGYESTGKSPGHPLYGITASGKRAVERHTIAVDPRVIPLGSEVYVKEFNRVYVAEDTGGNIKGNRIDIYMEDINRARKFGTQEVNIIIRRVEKK